MRGIEIQARAAEGGAPKERDKHEQERAGGRWAEWILRNGPCSLPNEGPRDSVRPRASDGAVP